MGGWKDPSLHKTGLRPVPLHQHTHWPDWDANTGIWWTVTWPHPYMYIVLKLVTIYSPQKSHHDTLRNLSKVTIIFLYVYLSSMRERSPVTSQTYTKDLDVVGRTLILPVIIISRSTIRLIPSCLFTLFETGNDHSNKPT